MHINELITHITRALSSHCENPNAEAWWLLESITKKKQAVLIAEKEITLSLKQEEKLQSWITQRTKNHKPLQYILGSVPFCNVEIFTQPPILIPRPETEEWTAWLIKKLTPVKNEPLTILDLCAGSGCITLALAKTFPNATVIGSDINPQAINLCNKNKKHNAITNATFLQSDLYENFTNYKHKFDLIVSNPPYISEEEFKTLQKDVILWEDKNALVAQENGLAVHKKIISNAQTYLKKNISLQRYSLPQLLLEFGKGQESNIQKLLLQANFKHINIHKDLEKVYRWTTATIG